MLVRDLHSQNGIKVNNVVVKEAALQAGDIVQIAGLSLCYVEEAAPPLQNQDVAEPVKDDRTLAMPSPPTFSKPLPPPPRHPRLPAPPRRHASIAAPPAASEEPQTNPMAPPPRPARRSAIRSPWLVALKRGSAARGHAAAASGATDDRTSARARWRRR